MYMDSLSCSFTSIYFLTNSLSEFDQSTTNYGPFIDRSQGYQSTTNYGPFIDRSQEYQSTTNYGPFLLI